MGPKTPLLSLRGGRLPFPALLCPCYVSYGSFSLFLFKHFFSPFLLKPTFKPERPGSSDLFCLLLYIQEYSGSTGIEVNVLESQPGNRTHDQHFCDQNEPILLSNLRHKKVSRGVRRTRPFCCEEGASPCQRCHVRLMLISGIFYIFSPQTHTQTRVFRASKVSPSPTLYPRAFRIHRN